MHTDGMSLLSLVFTAHKSLTKSPVLLAGENNSRKPSGFNWMTGNFLQKWKYVKTLRAQACRGVTVVNVNKAVWGQEFFSLLILKAR